MAAATTYGIFPAISRTEINAAPLLYSGDHMQVVIPKERLLPGSLWIESKHTSTALPDEAHLETYDLIQKVAAIWKKEKGITHFFVIAKSEAAGRAPIQFRWEMIPFPDSQLSVLSRISFLERSFRLFMRANFGGYLVSPSEVQREYAFYEPRKAIFSQPFVKEADKVEETRKDFFCDSEKRAKQLIFEGRNVNVYYDYAPLGVPLKKGEPAVHFLIAPKAHRENFYSLTKWEYLETSLYASALNEHYTKEREADCYHIHRTGRRLQSVWHHHQHFHANPREKDFGVKMTVLSKMLLGGRVLPPAELQKSVDELRPHVESLLSPLRVRAMELEQSSEKVHLRSKL